MRRMLVVAVLAGCAGYEPGTFVNGTPFAGARATVGCLDVAVERRADMASAAVIVYAIGNRCSHATPVDFSNVAVRGRAADGNERRLHAFDPANEVVPLMLEGRHAGREVLAYPDGHELAEICIDVASLAQQTTPNWVCVRQDAMVAEVTP